MSEPADEEPKPLNPYDEVPYGGRTVPRAHPERLALEAMRKGLSPAPPDHCRILELGCAEGGNVLPIAFHLDRCQVVGVDGSEVQVKAAIDARDRLGLDNLELRHADFLELDPAELGQFDYILCHGVYSWVAEPVRQKILAVCRATLSKNGVAFLSYNCTPGWAFRSLMRRALTERVRGATDPDDRIRRVREVIAWMASSPLAHSPWGALLAEEAAALVSHRDAYLVHEYLSPENQPFHFREIVDAASGHGLRFLSELARATTDPRVEAAMKESFAGAVDDPVEVEELCELFLFRAFRCSLFVRDDVELGEPHPELQGRVRFAGHLEPASKRVSLEVDVHEFFQTDRGARISAKDPVLKAALIEIGRWWPQGLSFDELTQRVTALLEVRRVFEPGQTPSEEQLTAMRNDLLELGQLDYLDLRLLDPALEREATDAPRVSALTRYQASRDRWLTTPHHHVAPLDAFSQILVRYLDGARTIEELTAKMRTHAEDGDVSLTLEDGVALDAAGLDEAVPKIVLVAINALAAAGLLVADRV